MIFLAMISASSMRSTFLISVALAWAGTQRKSEGREKRMKYRCISRESPRDLVSTEVNGPAGLPDSPTDARDLLAFGMIQTLMQISSMEAPRHLRTSRALRPTPTTTTSSTTRSPDQSRPGLNRPHEGMLLITLRRLHNKPDRKLFRKG